MLNNSMGDRPITFQKGNLSVAEVADAMGMDRQTIRILIQTEAVPWGRAVKKPGSSQFLYVISPKKLYEETGILLGAEPFEGR